jgi:lipopolysaccharide transport system ATP-binding protein
MSFNDRLNRSTGTAAAIRLDAIGKCYRVYQNPQDRFRQALRDRVRGFWSKRHDRPLYREHWALRDVSFELAAGQAMGVIGRNGAGKSTLLQIIAGTLEATEGAVTTAGRITALLELGSGFNVEFTGRENVFLNAQILGLSRADARERFDEIASFADIGDFIDQPVKTYSSGMVMRLAFAVQTVLEPAILIVDEALGVGDAKFQAKCFRKIRALRDRGVAILLVSHDVNAIISFCDRAILLDRGRQVEDGDPRFVVKRYIERLYSDVEPAPGPAPKSAATSAESESAASVVDASGVSEHLDPLPEPYVFGTRTVEILSVWIADESGRRVDMVTSGSAYRITQRVIAHADVFDLASGFMIRNRLGIELFGISNKTTGVPITDIRAGQIFDVSVSVQMWLAAGEYFVQAANAAPDGTQYDCRIDALHFTVVGTPQLFTTSLVNLNAELGFRILDVSDRGVAHEAAGGNVKARG